MTHPDFPFGVFLSHASEDKPAVRRLARQLETAGFKVWLDEEQLNAGQEPQKALPEALKACRHILIWITERWLAKDYTQWELKLFHGISDPERRVVPVLLVPWDDTTLGPYLTRKVAVELGLSEPERLWRIVCGLRGAAAGPRADWAQKGESIMSGNGSRAGSNEARETGGRVSTMLTPEAIEEVVELALACDLEDPERRDLLLAGLPASARGGLRRSSIPADQLRLDLGALSAWRQLEGLDLPPICIWLDNAARLAGPRPQASEFRRWRARFEGAAVSAEPPTPNRSAPTTPTDAALVRVLADAYSSREEIVALWQRAGGRPGEVDAIPNLRDLWQRLWTRSKNGAAVRPAVLLRAVLEDLPHNEVVLKHLEALEGR